MTASLLGSLVFGISGAFSRKQGELKGIIEKHGGTVTTRMTDVAILISDNVQNSKWKAAENADANIVTEAWLDQTISIGMLQTADAFFLRRSKAHTIGVSGGGTVPSVVTIVLPAATSTPASTTATSSLSSNTGVATATTATTTTTKRTRAMSQSKTPSSGRKSRSSTSTSTSKSKQKEESETEESDDDSDGESKKKKARGSDSKNDAKSNRNDNKDGDNDTDTDTDTKDTSSNTDDNDDDDDDDDTDGGEEQKKKIIVKGRAPVDERCPHATQCHVYEDSNGRVWDAMLNQTDIGRNANKFYLVQLLESDAGGTFYVWNRWGRVGVPGSTSSSAHGASLASAKHAFCNKFKDKTGNDWESVSTPGNFVVKRGKYVLLERDFTIDDDTKDESKNKNDDGDDDDENDGKSTTTKQKRKSNQQSAAAVATPQQQVQCTLDKRVQNLITLICDVNMMNRQMIEMEYDVKKMPLGKLSKAHILRGFDVLNRINAELSSQCPHAETLQTLSSEFYTLIPHSVGMQRLPVIRDKTTLQRKIQLVEALSEVELAIKLIGNNGGNDGKNSNPKHPLDIHYENLRCGIRPLEADGTDMALIKRYVTRTHGATHTSFRLEVEDAFALDRGGEDVRFAPHGADANRMLLWHGSRLTNFVGILSQGLRIAPPEAPVTGYMFGKGVYFADMVSKSANYCATSSSANTGLMLLCEVALGSCNELYSSDYNANNLPPGKGSTKGCGASVPNAREFETLANGCVVPCGAPAAAPLSAGRTYHDLLYNEYIVYDTAKIRMRYLVRLRFVYR